MSRLQQVLSPISPPPGVRPTDGAAARPRLTSVVLCTAGERDALLRCLAALDAHPPAGGHEVIVVDNGAGIGAEVHERFPSVRVIANAENVGVGRARNQGLDVARGEYLSVLDSDAYVTDGALEGLCAFLDAHPDVGLVGPRLVYDDGTFQHSRRRMPSLLAVVANRVPRLSSAAARRRYLMLDAPRDVSMDVDYVLGATMVFRNVPGARQAFPFVHYGFVDDADWCLRFRLAGWRVVYLPDVTVVHGYRRRTVKRPFTKTTVSLVAGYLVMRVRYGRAYGRGGIGGHR